MRVYLVLGTAWEYNDEYMYSLDGATYPETAHSTREAADKALFKQNEDIIRASINGGMNELSEYVAEWHEWGELEFFTEEGIEFIKDRANLLEVKLERYVKWGDLNLTNEDISFLSTQLVGFYEVWEADIGD